ncbi:hypothetical protein GCM10022295_05310 [Streptomyces osmaniensis]|uniref:Transposase n=1 Tax=Streptomyces osmaniensis TaxID=593134 RepID=A0ABP6V3L6_9ACTN
MPRCQRYITPSTARDTTVEASSSGTFGCSAAKAWPQNAATRSAATRALAGTLDRGVGNCGHSKIGAGKPALRLTRGSVQTTRTCLEGFGWLRMVTFWLSGDWTDAHRTIRFA